MKEIRLFLVLAIGLIIVAPIWAEERVVGSNKIYENVEPDTLLLDIMGLTITQNEVKLFLNVIDPIEKWGNTNNELWNRVEDAENPILAYSNLEVWKNVNVTYKEFLALAIKLQTAQKIFLKKIDVEGLKEQAASNQRMISDKNVPDEIKEERRKDLSVFKKIITVVESYPAENLKIYEANKEKLENALVLYEGIGIEQSQKGR